MFEAEIKLRISPGDAEPLVKRIEAAGFLFSKACEQTDGYFVSPVRDFQKTDEALRLRSSKDVKTGEFSAFLTYKGPKLSGGSVSRSELETGVQSAGETENILSSIGFPLKHRLIKKRRYYVRDDVTLSVDEVEGVGWFMELEEMTGDPEKIPAITGRLYEIARALGVPRQNAETKSYLELYLEKGVL